MKSALLSFFFLKGAAAVTGAAATATSFLGSSLTSSFLGSSIILGCSSIFGGSSTGLIFSALVTSIILAEFLVGVVDDYSSLITTGEVISVYTLGV
jgi:hypothetical protein